MRDKIIVFLSLVGLASSYYAYSQHRCERDMDIIGNLSNKQKMRVVYLYTLQDCPQDSENECEEFNELLQEVISWKYPLLSLRLGITDAKSTEEYLKIKCKDLLIRCRENHFDETKHKDQPCDLLEDYNCPVINGEEL